MRMVSTIYKHGRRRGRNERGAALVMSLLMSTMLLTAGGALILTTALSATNAYDSTAETQAYYAAEAGLQATLNVLRGNVAPVLTYRSAVTPATSNVNNDPATTAATPRARLSRWLAYDATFTDRVVLNTPYSPFTGSAYNAVLTDPDNTTRVTFSTTGVFDNGTATKTFNGAGANTATITYIPQPTTTVTAYPNVASLLGSFRTFANNSASIPAGTTFTLTINQTAPWEATYVINCTMSSTSNLTSASSTVAVDLKAVTYDNKGTLYTFTGLIGTRLRLNPPNTNGGLTNVAATLTASEPRRIRVQVNGFGPRGSSKQMEMMVNRYILDYWPSGLIAIRSADDNVTPMTFDSGSSAVYSYSGTAAASNQAIAAFAVTSTVDYNMINNIGAGGQVTGNPAAYKVPLTSLVSWLQTADAARRELNKMQTAAKLQDRYFTNASPPASYGTAANPLFTFVDGDAVIDGDVAPDGGHGLLVCTGTVTLSGNVEFKGLMIVLGGGQIIRNGGGNGGSLGAFALARFDRAAWGAPFLAPTFNSNGAGNSSVTYDPDWLKKALLLGSRYAVGVSEY